VFLAVSTAVFAEGVVMEDSHLAALDKDGDGAVSKQEYETFTRFAFDTIDTNDDGSLSSSELGVYVAGSGFSILDDDGDGSVTSDEFMTQMAEDFAVGDQDGDGALS
jgi:Ca2+-binding EF-hand superfamily protein